MQAIAIILSAALAVLANVAAQVISHRLMLRGRLVATLAVGFGAGLAVLALSSAAVYLLTAAGEGFGWRLASALLIYASGSFVFLCLVAASETSVRIELLRNLSRRGGMTGAELDALYDNESLVRRRLNRLLEAGAIRKANERYQLVSTSLLFIARLFVAAKVMIYGVNNEFGARSRSRGLNRDLRQGRG
jgi:hypothetical protein